MGLLTAPLEPAPPGSTFRGSARQRHRRQAEGPAPQDQASTNCARQAKDSFGPSDSSTATRSTPAIKSLRPRRSPAPRAQAPLQRAAELFARRKLLARGGRRLYGPHQGRMKSCTPRRLLQRSDRAGRSTRRHGERVSPAPAKLRPSAAVEKEPARIQSPSWLRPSRTILRWMSWKSSSSSAARVGPSCTRSRARRLKKRQPILKQIRGLRRVACRSRPTRGATATSDPCARPFAA